jgi:hypothetical protein
MTCMNSYYASRAKCYTYIETMFEYGNVASSPPFTRHKARHTLPDRLKENE